MPLLSYILDMIKVAFFFLLVQLTAAAPCDQDFSPCSCSNTNYITCDGVSVEDIQDVFWRTNEPEIGKLQLTLPYSDIINFPKDFFGNTSVGIIWILQEYHQPNEFYSKLLIDPLAFRVSKNRTTDLWFKCWDWDLQTDLSFLNGFDRLVKLYLTDTDNLMALQYLPPLPSLELLNVENCTNLNEITFPDVSPARLKSFYLQYNDGLDEKVASDIIASLARSTSANSLEHIDMSYNPHLGNIPKRISSAFPKLNFLSLNEDAISHIPSSSFVFNVPVTFIDLVGNEIRTIESGAFVGNFSRAFISLAINKFTLFEEGVFKQVLQQMVPNNESFSSTGTINLFNAGPFECGCDMAWLIQENRNLLRAINSGICGSNSQYPNASFYSLSSESFTAKCTKGLATNFYYNKMLTYVLPSIIYFFTDIFNP